MDLEDQERLLRAKLDAMGPRPREEVLRVLMLPDYDRASRIGDFYADPRTKTFAELLMDLEESPGSRSVVLGLLQEEELREGGFA